MHTVVCPDRRIPKLQCVEYAYRTAVDFVERAKQALYAFPAGSERAALMALPDYVLSRDR